MQRHEMIEAFTRLGLKGMAGAFDEAVTTGLQRGRTIMEILTDLLGAETAHRQAASIRYRLAAAKLPMMKDLAAFSFDGSPINEGLVIVNCWVDAPSSGGGERYSYFSCFLPYSGSGSAECRNVRSA